MKKFDAMPGLLMCVALLFGCASNTSFVELEKAVTLSEAEISNELVGMNRNKIVDGWGEPDSSLSGVYVDVYTLEDSEKHIIVYYNADGIVETAKINSNTSEVTISIKEDSIGDTGLILLIENNTSKEFSYDMTYVLEQKKDENWYSLNGDKAFNALGAILEPNKVNEFHVTWDTKLLKGSYRVVKPIATTDGISVICVEFPID